LLLFLFIISTGSPFFSGYRIKNGLVSVAVAAWKNLLDTIGVETCLSDKEI